MQSAGVVSRNCGEESLVKKSVQRYIERYDPITPEKKEKKGRQRVSSPRSLSVGKLLEIADKEGLRPAMVKGGLGWRIYLGAGEVYNPVTARVRGIKKKHLILFGVYYPKALANDVFGQVIWYNYRQGSLIIPVREFEEKFGYRINLPGELTGKPLCSDEIESGLYCLAVYENFAEH